MNIRSVISALFIVFLLSFCFTVPSAQADSMAEPSPVENQGSDVVVVEESLLILEPAPPRSDPYAVIEAARHGEREYLLREISLLDIQRVRGRLELVVIDARGRLKSLPSVENVSNSFAGGVRDHLNQIQQTIKLKISDLLERIGSKANRTAEQIRPSV